MAHMTVAEAFAGAGGLSLGLHAAGFTGVWAGEMDRWACESYARNFPDVPLFRGRLERGDEPGDMPPLDLLAGGPPCQPFSSAGLGRGQYDPRDGFPVYLSLLQRYRPRAFLIENVKGLTGSKHRPYLEQVLGDLIDSGYLVDYRVLNAADYGTPQRRERLVIVGFRDLEPAEAFRWPEPTHSGKGVPGLKPWRTVRDAIGDIVGLVSPGPTVHMAPVEVPMPGAVLLPPAEPVRRSREGSEKMQSLYVEDDPDEPLPTLQAAAEQKGSEYAARIRVGIPNHEPPGGTITFRKDGRGLNGNGPMLQFDEPSLTLTCGMHTGEAQRPVLMKPDGGVVRRLTIRECARLQGWPDTFVLAGPKTAQYKQVGNGVAFEMGRAVGQSIRVALES